MAAKHTALVTGSSGLIGSEVARYFLNRNWTLHGIDNNMRASFLGPGADTRWNQRLLEADCPSFVHHALDIRDRDAMSRVVRNLRPALIVHAAAQPSHDVAAQRPYDDFDVNAVGTLNLLEAARIHVPETVFILISTNKVYGDNPNRIRLKESTLRWDYDDPEYERGIPEELPIDGSLHSLFGTSKAAADLLVQEYGRYFGMLTCCLRCGCVTGARHSAVELHGFLSHLVRCNVDACVYTVFGHKGKQVRDNIPACDVAHFIDCFFREPRSAAVYNIGGGRRNSCSILEACELVARITGRELQLAIEPSPRKGDHICYISDLRRLRRDYPDWDLTWSLEEIVSDLVVSWTDGRHLRDGVS